MNYMLHFGSLPQTITFFFSIFYLKHLLSNLYNYILNWGSTSHMCVFLCELFIYLCFGFLLVYASVCLCVCWLICLYVSLSLSLCRRVSLWLFYGQFVLVLFGQGRFNIELRLRQFKMRFRDLPWAIKARSSVLAYKMYISSSLEALFSIEAIASYIEVQLSN